MIPFDLPQANILFHPPAEMTEEQCGSLRAFQGQITSGALDGSPVIVTAWTPSPEEIADLVAGGPVYVLLLAHGLPPHSLTTRCPVS